MFQSYNNETKRPDNRYIKHEQKSELMKIRPTKSGMPYVLYNLENKPIGYTWYRGDKVTLVFSIDGVVTLETDALVYDEPDKHPDVTTSGSIGQRCYNISDLRSWTCTYVDNDKYIWKEDAEFTYPDAQDRVLQIDASAFLSTKNVIISIYDHEFVEIFNTQVSGASRIEFNLPDELIDKLFPNVYYCSLKLVSENNLDTLFGPEDCVLLIK